MSGLVHQIGHHRARHGNVMNSDGIAELMNGVKASVIYSDPPWGTGNLKYWGTMNKKQTGDTGYTPPKEDAFIDQIFRICATYCDGPILLDMGVRWKDKFIEAGEAHGLIHHGYTTTVYGSKKRPLHHHVFSAQPIANPTAHFPLLEGMTGYAAVEEAIRPFAKPGGILLDPCCGMGYVARAATRLGMTFYGNELNRKRLQKTLNRLERDVN